MARSITPPCAINTASAPLLTTASLGAATSPALAREMLHIHDYCRGCRHRIVEGRARHFAIGALRQQRGELVMAIGGGISSPPAALRSAAGSSADRRHCPPRFSRSRRPAPARRGRARWAPRPRPTARTAGPRSLPRPGPEAAAPPRRQRRRHCRHRRSSEGCCGCRNRTSPVRPPSASKRPGRGCRRAAGKGQDDPHPHRHLARAPCRAGADSWAGHGPADCRRRAAGGGGGGRRGAGGGGAGGVQAAIARSRGNGTKAGQ